MEQTPFRGWGNNSICAVTRCYSVVTVLGDTGKIEGVDGLD